MTFLLNKRPCLSISSVRLQLPSSRDLWEADSAQAWTSLHPSSPLAPPRKAFSGVLGLIFSGSSHQIAQSLEDPQHRHFVILTLARMVWSWKEIQTAPGVHFGRFPFHQFQETKRELLKLLEAFRLGIMMQPLHFHSPSSVQGMLRSCLVIHMSHLYAADDLVDWFYPLIRRAHVATSWKSRALQWASKDLMKVREVAYYSAQTLAVARRFPSNFPTEVFNTFHAGLYLWLVSSLWQEQQDSVGVRSQELTLDIRLDQLQFESSNDGSSNIVAQWIKEGSTAGSTRVSIHGVPDLAGADGPRQILQQVANLLERMKVWKISQNLLRIVLSLLPETDVTSP